MWSIRQSSNCEMASLCPNSRRLITVVNMYFGVIFLWCSIITSQATSTKFPLFLSCLKIFRNFTTLSILILFTCWLQILSIFLIYPWVIVAPNVLSTSAASSSFLSNILRNRLNATSFRKGTGKIVILDASNLCSEKCWRKISLSLGEKWPFWTLWER